VKNMSKLTLDSVEWGEFRIKDLFEIETVKGKPIESYKKGNIPYVSTAATNNAVINFIEKEKNIITSAFAITVDPIKGTCFFHDYDFVGRGFSGASVSVLRNINLNKYNGMFICSSIEKTSKLKASYGYLFNSNRLKMGVILLPIDSNNNPNWKFMEDYIKQEMKKQSQKVITYYENKLMKLGFELLDLEVEWKEFWMEEILNINSGVRLTKADQIIGDTPFIGASDSNNGVTEFIGNVNNSLDSNVLGVNYNGSVVENFYHSYECIFSDDVKRIKYKDEEFGDEFTYLFLKQMILSQKNKYKYGYKFNAKRMNRQKIMLPVNNNGKLHWEYMNNFIKKLEKENIEKILNYLYIYNN
jgi:restriction enzyme bgcI subunit beta